MCLACGGLGVSEGQRRTPRLLKAQPERGAVHSLFIHPCKRKTDREILKA